MQSKEFQQLQKGEKSRDQKSRSERFWRAFLFTEGGKVKSTLLLYSFCLSIAFAAVYFGAFYFLLDGLHALVEGKPLVVVHLVESLVPALVGTTLCSTVWLFSRGKRLLMATYLWMGTLALACLVTMLLLLKGDAQAQTLFLQFFVLLVPAPVLLGGGCAFLLYFRHRKPAPPEKEFWKRQ